MNPIKFEFTIGLSEEALAQRQGSIGGSDANVLMSGDGEKIYRLWQEKTGRLAPEDLSDVLPVVMGQYTEALNVYWYERQTGAKVTHRGEVRTTAYLHSDKKNWDVETYEMSCTLDGLTTHEGEPCVFEAKHVNAFSTIEDVEQRYMPQLHHNMFCCQLNRSVLSVFVGTLKWTYTVVEYDPFYGEQLLERERAFWKCVIEDTPPPEMSVIQAPVPREEWTTVDMTGNNEWAALAQDWLENADAAKAFKAAEKGLKSMVPVDAGLCLGHGIEIKRAKNNSLRIREKK